MTDPIISRRAFAAGAASAAALAVSGCASDRGDFGRIANLLGSELGLGGQAPSDGEAAAVQGITREKVLEIPYPTIGVRIGPESPQGLFILARRHGGEDLWTLAYRSSIVTRDGRVTRISGFPENLEGTRFDSGGDPIWAAYRSGAAASGRRQMDFHRDGLLTVEVDATAAVIGSETIEVLGAKIACVRVDENCVARDVEREWSFRNFFWIGAKDGFVWRSIQAVNPKSAQLEIDTLRPAAAPSA